ncbi:YbgA family protein [Pseudomonas spelaei]
MSNPAKPKIGISACLLGENVRFNGGHKQSLLCTQILADYFDYVPLCPEVAIGLGIPRETIRLVGDAADPQAVGTVHRDLNVTRPLDEYGRQMAREHTDLCGYIFMQKSPSCGLERVKVYRENGAPVDGGGRGIYARAFCARHPNLPVEEDGRLNDPVLRENFLTRVFVYASWQRLLAEGLTRHRLLAFHSRYKYLLMAHSPVHYKRLGHLLGSMEKTTDLEALSNGYFSDLMTGLTKCATRGTHSNVLQHISGYLKQVISADDKQEMQTVIGQYRHGIVPLVVPLTLLKHHFRQHPDRYIAQQAYLQPHPENLSLRNAI